MKFIELISYSIDRKGFPLLFGAEISVPETGKVVEKLESFCKFETATLRPENLD